MFFAWIFICRLHRGYKKVSTKISFSYQFATILMDQLLSNVTLLFTSLFWWRIASTCILFTAFHLLLLVSSLLWVIFFCSNLLSPSCNVGPNEKLYSKLFSFSPQKDVFPQCRFLINFYIRHICCYTQLACIFIRQISHFKNTLKFACKSLFKNLQASILCGFFMEIRHIARNLCVCIRAAMPVACTVFQFNTYIIRTNNTYYYSYIVW